MNEYKEIKKETLVDVFEVMSRHLPLWTEETH
jgi:hypothetical protein